MTESLLDASLDDDQTAAVPSVKSTNFAKTASDGRPPQLPEKFWDAAKGEIRIDALVKSYLELERKLGTSSTKNYPENPEDYEVQITHDLLSSDQEINRLLHHAGFSQEQVQLVYDLAAERLLPMVSEIAALFESEKQIEALEKNFGGEQRWREVARQLNAWGQKNLPARVFEALAMTSEGVLAMHRMMTGSEPGLLQQGDPVDSHLSEKQLKNLMRDPRYWRDHDPIMVERVRDGFRRLYKDEHV